MNDLSATLGALAEAAWAVTLELAPWLLLGAFVAGVLHVVVPPGFVRRHLTGRFAVMRSVLLGVPLPLCSCGVIPAGLSLRKQGASDGATVAFLIATPQTGVDSILVSGSMLGWPFAIFKVASAFVLGLVGGGLVDRLQPSAQETEAAQTEAARPTIREGVAHAVEMIRSIWKWLLFGVAASAALTVFVPQDAFAGLGAAGGLLAMVAMLGVSVPLYVCATASVPIAAALVAGGFPAGAALVFLMAGPATNLATLGVVRSEFGGRVLAIYLGTIVIGSVGLGYAFESLLEGATIGHLHPHAHGAGFVALAGAAVLCAMVAWFLADDLRSKWRSMRSAAATEDAVEVLVDGMTCNGCVRKLTGVLESADGVASATVVLEPAGKATVVGSLPSDEVRALIRNAGFVPH